MPANQRDDLLCPVINKVKQKLSSTDEDKQSHTRFPDWVTELMTKRILRLPGINTGIRTIPARARETPAVIKVAT